MIELVQDFNLVSFYPLCVDDAETVVQVIRAVDTAIGYSGVQVDPQAGLMETVTKYGEWMDEYDRILDVQERYVGEVDDQEEEPEDEEFIEDDQMQL